MNGQSRKREFLFATHWTLKRDTAAMEFFHLIHCNATSQAYMPVGERIAGELLLARKASYDCPRCDWWMLGKC